VPRTRPPYPEEFRREAIRLALLGDKPQRQLAKDLGISEVTLRNCGRPPHNKGLRYPAAPPKVEEIVAVMRAAGDRPHGRRLRA
jgi:transposase-like protein